MAKPRMDLTAFVGKLPEEQDGDVLREGIRVAYEFGTVSAEPGNGIIDVFDGKYDAASARRVRRALADHAGCSDADPSDDDQASPHEGHALHDGVLRGPNGRSASAATRRSAVTGGILPPHIARRGIPQTGTAHVTGCVHE